MWILVDGLLVVARKSYYGIPLHKPPTRWANWRIRLYKKGMAPP